MRNKIIEILAVLFLVLLISATVWSIIGVAGSLFDPRLDHNLVSDFNLQAYIIGFTIGFFVSLIKKDHKTNLLYALLALAINLGITTLIMMNLGWGLVPLAFLLVVFILQAGTGYFVGLYV